MNQGCHALEAKCELKGIGRMGSEVGLSGSVSSGACAACEL